MTNNHKHLKFFRSKKGTNKIENRASQFFYRDAFPSWVLGWDGTIQFASKSGVGPGWLLEPGF